MPQTPARLHTAHPHRVDAHLLLGAVLTVVVAAVATAWAATPAFSWRHSMISDLGATSCIVRAGVPMCSPRAVWLDAGLVVAGFAVVAATVRANARWDRAFRAGLGCLGVGLIVVGVCPSDRLHDAHMVGAVLALPACAACLLVSGVTDGASGAGQRRRRTALASLALIVCLVHLVPDAVPVPRVVAELVSVAAIVGVLGSRIARSWAAAAAPASPTSGRAG